MEILRIIADLGRDDVIGHGVLEMVEPESRHLRQDFALIWNGRREHDVKCGKPVGGDNEKVLTEIVDVANLAPAVERDTGKIGFDNSCHLASLCLRAFV